MAKEIVQSLREVDGKYEQYYFATVLSAVAVTDADDETRNAKEYIDSLVSATTDAMRFMGVIGENGVITSSLEATSGKVFADLTDYKIGWSFKVGFAGTYAGQVCEVGDMLICVGTAKTNADWYVLQANIDGAVIGPASASDKVIAMFDGTSGKVIADSGISKTSIENVIAVSHTHTNKAILDELTQDMLNMLKNADLTALAKITDDMVTLWNNYSTKIAEIESKLVYTNSTPTISTHGGIAAGTTFDNVPIADMFTKILYPYVAPTISVSVTAPSNGGVFEKGSTKTVTNIRASVGKKSASITKVEIFDGSTSLGSKTEGVTNGGNFDFTVNVDVTTNKNFKAIVKDSENKSYSANTGTFTFVHPFYTGVCAGDATITADMITGFTKKIETKGNKTISYNCNNQSMVFAYDASYGSLKSRIDPKKFNVTDTFTRTTVNVTTLDGTTTQYYVYKNPASTVTGFAMKFNF